MSERLMVIGAGTMGNGIAQVFAAKGYEVLMVDVDEKALARGMKTISGSLERLVKKERITEEERNTTLARIQTSSDPNDGAEVFLAIEAATENQEIKEKIFAQLAGIVREDAWLATNTSSISIDELASGLPNPSRFLGMHFMNPGPMMKLVEIIRGKATSREVEEGVLELTRKLGKIPVLVNDAPGFVANRILMPMINEACFTLEEGVGEKEAIDTIMKLGMAHPMGPLELADLIGLDVCLSIMEVLHEGFDDEKYRPSPLLQRLVAEGKLGRKTGEGFYDYRKEGASGA
ncbi:MAG: 3-hydroxybutyryl-CoA dehydrogenase [Candidatus Krumholzibacteria bacterium]|nr:3-hydroxybutyryl-CoA dehydrogenase [Candidatus Krumholzibacteria bacterium]